MIWGVGVLASFTALRFLAPAKGQAAPAADGKKLRMLDQDGRLVEVDASLVSGKGKKVSDEELQFWITNKAVGKK
jgi:hypothetical protein